jgi:hypothetical protein
MLRVAMKRALSSAPVIACQMRLPAWRGTFGVGSFGASRVSFTAGTGFSHFKQVLAHLRETCPAAKPVIVRTSWLPNGNLGECIRRPERFVIKLSDKLNETLAVETLLHEWSHALAWNFTLDALARNPHVDREKFEAEAHGEAWGCAYSRVWREFLKCA